MSTAVAAKARDPLPDPLDDDEANTLSDLIEALGGISPARIIRRPPPGTATEEDVIRLMEAPRKRLCELIDGVLVEKPTGWRESVLAGVIISSMANLVRTKNLGFVAGADGTVRLWRGRVRIPDVGYYSWGRLPGRRMPDAPIPEIAPDIAVEVLSESNTKKEMETKRAEYFRMGARLVWEVDPDARTVAAYTAPDQMTLLRPGDLLDGGAALPGFSLALSEMFRELDRHG
jgi:Uma2 family endonuclease